MASHRRLTTALVGTGRIAPAHLSAVRKSGLSDVKVIGGSDPQHTQRMAAEWGVPTATTVSGVLEDSDLDVVHIIGTNDVHAEIAIRAIRAGKHVVLEKPIALKVSDAEDIVDAAEAHGVLGLTTFTYWGFPAIQEMRSRISADSIGRPHLVHGSYLQDWLASPSTYDWRCDPAIGGPSRALADIGTHWFSLVEFVTGARIDAVIADLGRVYERRGGAGDQGGGKAVANEDTASVLVRLSNGAHGALVVSQVSHGHENHISVEISGPSGTLAWDIERAADLREQRPSSSGDGHPAVDDPHEARDPQLQSREDEWTSAFDALVGSFYREVAGVATADSFRYPTLGDGARAVAIVEAAMRSSDSGTWERVTELSRAVGAP